jgi:ubiquinone/menaquinone biosynthesis C-methylase UbiE
MSIYPKLFAKLYDTVLHGFEQKLRHDREAYLKDLKGKIIDVGSGTGANFEFFNADSEILAIEPAIEMLNKSKGKIARKNIQLIHKSITDTSLDDLIKPHSIDAIICTLVLCTIPDPDLALQKFKKWLKPEGELIIIEHIHSDKKWNASFQHFINPLWNKIGEGCNLTRNTDQLILEHGFQSNNHVYFHLGLRIVKGVYKQIED